MTNMVVKFINDESGATAIEYALLAALISVAILGGATLLGNSVSSNYVAVGEDVTSASTVFSES